MKKIICTTLLLWSACLLTYAQNDLSLSLKLSPESPDHKGLFSLRENPALIHWMANDSTFSLGLPSFHKNIIRSGIYTTKTQGDFLFHQGNHTLAGGAYAFGEKHYTHLGTLYGSVSYVREYNKDVSLNYAINPMDYYPYLVADSLGSGKVRKETYTVKGGFGFNLRKTYLGVYGEYEGIVSSKQTDPKQSAYNSWFRMNAGIATSFKNQIFSAYIQPELNKQHISVGGYKHASVKYFQFYGFGEWSHKESKAGYNYGRMMSIKGVKSNITFKRRLNHIEDFNYQASLSYHFQRMDTEENTYKNLFQANTHQLYGEIILSKRFGKWATYLLYSGDYSIRKGTESIYENKEVSEEQSLYDYTKVGENQLYKLTQSHSNFTLKATNHFSNRQAIEFSLGSKLLYYKETYLSPEKEIMNSIVQPFIDLSYKLRLQKHQMEFYSKWESRLPSSNTFKNPISSDDFMALQQSYIPFLIRGESAQAFSLQAIHAYTLKNKQRIGTTIGFSYYHRSKKNHESAYQIGYSNRQQTNVNMSIFYLF